MQNIGQTAFAAVGRQQVFGNMTRPHQRAQHWHHATLAPDVPVFTELLYQRIPGTFILIEVFDILRIKAKHRRRQRAA